MQQHHPSTSRRRSRAQAMTIADLATRVQPISGHLPCGDVERMLVRSTATSLVARTSDSSYLLIDRPSFLAFMAGPIGYGRTLHAAQPVELMVPPDSMVLPGETSVADSFECILTRSPERRFQDIVVTFADGVGILEASFLLSKVAESNAEDALNDPLTGLGNRALVMDAMDRAARTAPESWTALLFVDLDRFKVVNDGMGHDAGDALLVAIASRIRDVLDGRGMAARLGGDEFAVLVRAATEEDVRAIAESLAGDIIAALRAPVRLERQVTASASVGIAVAPASEGAETLLRCADIAMYQAKRHGGGHYRFFQGDDDAEARRRMDIEIWLREALEQDRLGVVYQPIVALDGLQLLGFEALVRGHHPEQGLLPPAQFLDVAEEVGLLPQVDFRVLRRGLRQVAAWHEMGATALRLSVNLSGRTLRHPESARWVLDALASVGVAPDHLTVEVTEGEMLHDVASTTALLTSLREAGVRVAIDDFGTGYSSLSQLADLPFDILKIDRTFISRIADTGRDMEMVRMILALARGLRVQAIAEGVEVLTQASTLRAMGCEAGQGYLFSQPIDFAAATQLIEHSVLPVEAAAA